MPRARSDKLVVRRFDGDLMVYDRELDRASCLNAFAADVWARCDGQSSVAAIAQGLAATRREPVDERAVWLALDQLSRARLLEQPVEIPRSVLGSKGRRRLLLQALKLAAAAVPAVLSIVVPTVAGAQSCRPSGATCETNAQCCTGLCIGAPPAGICL